jgi:hypothetical protein
MCDSKKASHPGFQAGVFFVRPEAKRLLQRRARGRRQRFVHTLAACFFPQFRGRGIAPAGRFQTLRSSLPALARRAEAGRSWPVRNARF